MTEFADRALVRNGAPSNAAELLAAVEAESVVRVADAELLHWLAAHLPADRFVVRKLSEISVSAALAELSEYAPLPPAPPAPEPLTLDSLVSALKAALLARAAAARAACDEQYKATATVDPQLRALAETHAPGVAALLDGPTKDALLQGTARAPSALAALAAGEVGEFVPAHFEFATVPSHRLVDVKVQRYVQKLKTNTQNERATAAALANEVRDEVLAARGSLNAPPEREPAQVYAETVSAIHDSGKILVLLLEAPDAEPAALQLEGVRAVALSATEDAFALASQPVVEVAPEPEPIPEPVAEVAPLEPAPEPEPIPEPVPEPVAEVAPVAEPEFPPAEVAPEEVPAEVAAEPVVEVAPAEPEVPADLRAFLEAVADGGAPLELVTPTVLGWLRARGELGAFVVARAARSEDAEEVERHPANDECPDDQTGERKRDAADQTLPPQTGERPAPEAREQTQVEGVEEQNRNDPSEDRG
jgi:hypothetical protein